MEPPVSGTGEALILKMRALARRGALLKRGPDGGGSIDQGEEGRLARPVTPQELRGLLEAGWLRQQDANSFVISRRGVTALKGMLSRETALAASRSISTTSAAMKPAAVPRPRGEATPELNARESPIAWLRQRRDANGKPMISDSEFEAGERLRRDFELGHLGARVTASWDPTATSSVAGRGGPGRGLELSEAAMAARLRVDAALTAVGPELSGMLLDVCCYLKGLEQAECNGGWPRRAGKVVLQLGLAHLARHYGFGRQGRGGGCGIRSWGAPDYRPVMDAGQEE